MEGPGIERSTLWGGGRWVCPDPFSAACWAVADRLPVMMADKQRCLGAWDAALERIPAGDGTVTVH